MTARNRDFKKRLEIKLYSNWERAKELGLNIEFYLQNKDILENYHRDNDKAKQQGLNVYQYRLAYLNPSDEKYKEKKEKLQQFSKLIEEGFKNVNCWGF